MKRLLLALSVATLLVWLALPALASQGKPVDPAIGAESTTSRLSR
jgi:hypothetical protein